MQQDDIIIDGPELTRAFRRQIRIWIPLGLFLFGLLLLLALFLVPRSYTASVSIALQQPSSSGSALAALTGGSTSSKRYIGVLKSREMAQAVESQVHLRQLYGATGGMFDTESDTIEYLMKNIRPDDNSADGLLYVGVTLPGPPKLALKHSPTEMQIQEAAAEAANAYALALQKYFAVNDTDQGAVLLRGVDKAKRQARADYEKALRNVLNFNRSLGGADMRNASLSSQASPSVGASGAMPTADAGMSASGLGALEAQLSQVQADLRAATVSRQAEKEMTAEQIQSLPSVPADDPLLATIRNQVKQDQADYKTYSSLYGPEHPRVVAARARLQVDQAELYRQIQGVKNGLTTPNIRSGQQILSLYARQDELSKQIARARRRLIVSRGLSGEYGRLQAEVQFQAAVLQETLTQGARISMENASALNRMTIIDSAIPPKSGAPGVLKLALGSLALVLLAFCIAVARDYLRLSAATRAVTAPAGPAANGVGSLPTDETEDAVTTSFLRKP